MRVFAVAKKLRSGGQMDRWARVGSRRGQWGSKQR
jgi:hypothetical protein